MASSSEKSAVTQGTRCDPGLVVIGAAVAGSIVANGYLSAAGADLYAATKKGVSKVTNKASSKKSD